MSEAEKNQPRQEMEGYRPYPKYKDSGVEWLGEIPAHWEIQRLKRISDIAFSSVDKKMHEEEQVVHLCNYLDVYYNDYIRQDMEFMTATASQKEINDFTLREGDVILTKDSETWDDIGVPACVSEDVKGVVCGYHLALVRPLAKLSYGGFLFRALSARGICDQFWVGAKGVTRYGLSKTQFSDTLIPLPKKARATSHRHVPGP